MRCTGHCCRSFRLSRPPGNPASAQPLDVDDFTVATMVLPLGVFPAGTPLPNGQTSRGGAYYDCRHQQANGDCAIYESRPRMCRDYPKAGQCDKAGCTDACARPRLALVTA